MEKPASTVYFVRIGKLKAAGISPEAEACAAVCR